MDARSGAEAVRYDVGSGGKISLSVPVKRNRAGMQFLPPCGQMRFDLFIFFERKMEVFCNTVLGDVIGCRAESAGGNDRIRFGIGVVERFEDAVAPVRDFERELRNDPDPEQLFSEECQIGIDR